MTLEAKAFIALLKIKLYEVRGDLSDEISPYLDRKERQIKQSADEIKKICRLDGKLVMLKQCLDWVNEIEREVKNG